MKIMSSFFLIALLSIVPLHFAQADVLTGASIILGAKSVDGTLQNLGRTLGGEAQQQINNISENLHLRIQEIERILDKNVNTPIDKLSEDIRDAVMTFKNTSDNLSELVSVQANCIYVNADIMVSALENAALVTARSTILGKKQQPRISSIRFDGLPPLSVPMQGGRFSIRGLNIWSNTPPRLELTNEQRSAVLCTLTSYRGSTTNDDVSTYIDSTIILQHAGELVCIKLTTYKIKGWLFKKTVPVCTLFYSMKIPNYYTSKLFIYAGIKYECPNTHDSTFTEHVFSFSNSSCENNANVSEDFRWPDIPSNAQIVSFTKRKVEQHCDNNIGISIKSSNIISVGGTMDEADCARFGGGLIPAFNRLIEDAKWSYGITPTCEVKDSKKYDSTIVYSDTVNMIKSFELQVEIPKMCDSTACTFWFKVMHIFGNRVQTIYTSQPISAQYSPVSFPRANVDGLTIDAIANPLRLRDKVNLLCKFSHNDCQ